MTAAAPRLSIAAALALLGVALGATLLVLGLGSWPGTYYSLIRVVSIVVALVGLVVWLAIAVVRPEHRPASGLAGAFAAALAAFAISALNAPNVRYGFDFLGYAIVLTALYLLFVRAWASAAVAARLEVLLTLACLAGGILFVAATAYAWVDIWDRVGRFVIPPLRASIEGLWIGTPNGFAAFQVLVYCGVVTALVERGRGGRVLAVVLGVVVAIDVFLSASRGAWLGVALAVVVTAVAWLLTTDRDALRRAWRRVWTGRTRFVVVGVAALGALALVAGVVAVLPRLGDTSGAALRASLIEASVRMFQAAPLTGLGPGSWAPNRIAYTDASGVDYYIPHAHNVPAQTLAEFGLVGVLAAIVVVALLVRLIVVGLRRGDGHTRWLALATLFACVYITGQQLVDAWIHQPAILFALAVPIARLDAALPPGSGPSPTEPLSPGLKRQTLALTIVLLVAVVVGSGAALWPEGAADRGLRAVGAADDGRWAEAYDLSTQAAQADPRIPPYQLLRGLSAANLGDLATARDALAAATADDFPATWLDLAAVQARLGDTEGAFDNLARAIRLGPQQTGISVAAAGLAHDLGDDAEARRLLAAAFALLPSLAADPYWQQPAWQAIADGAVTDAVRSADPWQAMLLALETGRFDDARATLGRLDPSARALGETVVAAWSGDQAAFERLHQAARDDPLDAQTVALCRRVARIHDPSLATPGWACDGGFGANTYPVGRVGAGSNDVPLPGPDAFWQGAYAYRRPGPQDLLVPWLLHVHADDT